MAKKCVGNKEIAFLEHFQKRDNRNCNKSIASLVKCACDRVLLSDRPGDVGMNVMTVSQECF